MEMNTNYKLRRAEKKEIGDVLELYNNLIDTLDRNINYPHWTKGYYPNLEYLEEKQKEGELFVLTDSGEIVGVSILNTSRIDDYKKVNWSLDVPEEEILTIHTFAIKDNLRQTGLGLIFLKLIEDYAKENNFKTIHLDTIYGNDPAVRLYEKAGYTNLGIHELVYAETNERRFNLFERNLE